MVFNLLIGTGSQAFHKLTFDPVHASLTLAASVQDRKPTWLAVQRDTLDVLTTTEDDALSVGALSLFKLANLASHQAPSANTATWQANPVWTGQASSAGTAHCSIVGRGGQSYYLAANYGGGSADVMDAKGHRTDSRQMRGHGPFPGRQTQSHVHQIVEDPWHEYIYAVDLGGDAVHQYTLDSQGKLKDEDVIKLKPGQGPRHVAFNLLHRDLLYVICELSNEIVLYRYKEGGSWTAIQTVKLIDAIQEGQKMERFPQPPSSAEIVISKDGKHLYASVRYIPGEQDADTLIGMALKADGTLDVSSKTVVNTELREPWCIALSDDQEQRYLAVVFKSPGVVKVYERTREAGTLKQVAVLTHADLTKPSFVTFI